MYFGWIVWSFEVDFKIVSLFYTWKKTLWTDESSIFAFLQI